MLRSVYRTRCLSAARVNRSASVALFHTTPRTFQASANVFEQQDVPQNVSTALDKRSEAALYAFGARLGLKELPFTKLIQSVTHASTNEDANNQVLTFLGKRITSLYATEFLYCKYPQMHVQALHALVGAYVNHRSVSHVASHLGFQDVVRYDPSQQNIRHSTALAEAFYSIVAAIYTEQGSEAAKKFVHAHILSRDLDIRPFIKFEQPKRALTDLLKFLGKEPAISRLLSETGRHSHAPVFVVGVFSGEEKLGEGFGSSKKMAEFRACQDALAAYYGKEVKDFELPSSH